MREYLLLFSKYVTRNNYSTYDVILYDNQFYAGTNLFKNFGNYLAKLWDAPVTKLFNYEQAKKHFLSLN